ncbi:MAG: histidine kinase dimerization/phospho-acceptor domain-containing protein, partial [Gemmatimonadaceae bacterium]
MTQTAFVTGHTNPESDAAPNTVVRLRSVPTRYGFALLCTLISLGITLMLVSIVPRSVFIFFWPAVIATAWFGGLGPALLCAFLSVTLVDYFIIPPAGFLGTQDPSELLAAAAFFGVAMLISWAVNLLENSRVETTISAKKNIALARQLDEQGIELTQQLEESQAMQEELEASTEELAERTGEAEAAEKFTRGVLESISDPFVVQDSEWRFQYFNVAAERLFSEAGMEKDTITGSVVWDLFPQIVGTDVERQMRQAFDSRTPTSFESYSQRTGTWSELFCYPLPDGGLGTQWKDITERKKSEESARYLAKASEVLSSSLDYETTLSELAHLIVPEFADWCAVAMANPNGGRPVELAVAHVDPEKVMWAAELNRKYPPPDDAPTGVPQVIRTGVAELYTEIPQELLEAGAQDEEHLEIIRKLGLRSAMIVPISTPKRILGAITVVSAESGRRYTQSDLEFLTELARRAALAVDNAEHHNAELEARHLAESANEAKTQFLAVMSHELRTPLNAIGGYAELLLLGIRGPLTDDQTADLERIQRSQRNLLSLINDILNYAKLEAGHVVLEMSEVDLGALFQEVEPLITPQLRAKGLDYICGLTPGAIAVWADAEKVRQILLNLL